LDSLGWGKGAFPQSPVRSTATLISQLSLKQYPFHLILEQSCFEGFWSTLKPSPSNPRLDYKKFGSEPYSSTKCLFVSVGLGFAPARFLASSSPCWCPYFYRFASPTAKGLNRKHVTPQKGVRYRDRQT